jgi:hypothetical protein
VLLLEIIVITQLPAFAFFHRRIGIFGLAAFPGKPRNYRRNGLMSRRLLCGAFRVRIYVWGGVGRRD